MRRHQFPKRQKPVKKKKPKAELQKTISRIEKLLEINKRPGRLNSVGGRAWPPARPAFGIGSHSMELSAERCQGRA